MLTATVIKEYQAKVQELKDEGKFTAGNFKALGRELASKYCLTDREALAILNNRLDEIRELLASVEK